jgi:hypothetical protein
MLELDYWRLGWRFGSSVFFQHLAFSVRHFPNQRRPACKVSRPQLNDVPPQRPFAYVLSSAKLVCHVVATERSYFISRSLNDARMAASPCPPSEAPREWVARFVRPADFSFQLFRISAFPCRPFLR